MQWNPDARDPWPAERYMREGQNPWALAAILLALGVLASFVVGVITA